MVLIGGVCGVGLVGEVPSCEVRCLEVAIGYKLLLGMGICVQSGQGKSGERAEKELFERQNGGKARHGFSFFDLAERYSGCGVLLYICAEES